MIKYVDNSEALFNVYFALLWPKRIKEQSASSSWVHKTYFAKCIHYKTKKHFPLFYFCSGNQRFRSFDSARDSFVISRFALPSSKWLLVVDRAVSKLQQNTSVFIVDADLKAALEYCWIENDVYKVQQYSNISPKILNQNVFLKVIEINNFIRVVHETCERCRRYYPLL